MKYCLIVFFSCSLFFPLFAGVDSPDLCHRFLALINSLEGRKSKLGESTSLEDLKRYLEFKAEKEKKKIITIGASELFKSSKFEGTPYINIQWQNDILRGKSVTLKLGDPEFRKSWRDFYILRRLVDSKLSDLLQGHFNRELVYISSSDNFLLIEIKTIDDYNDFVKFFDDFLEEENSLPKDLKILNFNGYQA